MKKSEAEMKRYPLKIVLDTREGQNMFVEFERSRKLLSDRHLTVEKKTLPAGDIAIAHCDDESRYLALIERKTWPDMFSTIRGKARNHDFQTVRGSYKNQADAMVKTGVPYTAYLLVGSMDDIKAYFTGMTKDACQLTVCNALVSLSFAFGDIIKILIAPSMALVPAVIGKLCDVIREQQLHEKFPVEPADELVCTLDEDIVLPLEQEPDRDFARFRRTLDEMLRTRQAVMETEVIRLGAKKKGNTPENAYRLMVTSLSGVTVDHFEALRKTYPTALDLYLAMEKQGPAALKVVEAWKHQKRSTVFGLLTGKQTDEFPADKDPRPAKRAKK